MGADDMAPGDLVERLYQVEPGGFVAERNRLAKEARAAGDRSAAEAIAGLRKPTVSAWAVNRIAREDAKGLKELFAANQKLRDAMSASGRAAGERFRTASEERQRVVGKLTERAEHLMEEAGLSASRANLDRVSATLLATATDEAGADLVRRAVLDSDLAPRGFGDLFGGIDLPPPESRPKGRAPAERRADRSTPTAEDRAAAERRGKAEREAEALDAKAKEAEHAADAAEKDAAEAEREAEAAAKAASVKRREADRARKEAVRARERARTAADRLTSG